MGEGPKIERLFRLFCLAVRPDGRQLAFGGGRFQKQGELYLLDIEAGARARPLQGHSGAVLAVAFSPDGQRLVSASTGADVEEDACSKAELFVWDVPTGQHLRELQGLNDAVAAAAFSPDGVTIAAICLDQTLRLWDTTDDCRHVFHGDARRAPTRLEFVSDDGLVSLHCDGTTQSWDLPLLRERAPSFLTLKDLHESALEVAAWSDARGDVASSRQALEESRRFVETAIGRFPTHRDARAGAVAVNGPPGPARGRRRPTRRGPPTPGGYAPGRGGPRRRGPSVRWGAGDAGETLPGRRSNRVAVGGLHRGRGPFQQGP